MQREEDTSQVGDRIKRDVDMDISGKVSYEGEFYQL